MRSPRENRKAIFEYIKNNGRARKSKLYEDFVVVPTHKNLKMSKQGLYNTLDRLKIDGKIIELKLPSGKKDVIYYELPLVDTIAQTKRFILEFKKETERNPDFEEIAIGLGKTPEEIKPAVYTVARDVDWEPTQTQSVIPQSPVGLVAKTTINKSKKSSLKNPVQELNKEEIKLIFDKLSKSETEEVAANYLLLTSARQPLLKYPNFIKSLLDALRTVKNDETIRELISSIYYIVSSSEFPDMLETEEINNEFKLLLDELFKIASSKEKSENVRSEAIRILGMRADKRIISILTDSLKNAKGYNQYEFQGTFDSWILSEFYKKHKMTLAEEAFEVARVNKEGAKMMIQLINKNWGW